MVSEQHSADFENRAWHNKLRSEAPIGRVSM
jgi:hypothetical protein